MSQRAAAAAADARRLLLLPSRPRARLVVVGFVVVDVHADVIVRARARVENPGHFPSIDSRHVEDASGDEPIQIAPRLRVEVPEKHRPRRAIGRLRHRRSIRFHAIDEHAQLTELLIPSLRVEQEVNAPDDDRRAVAANRPQPRDRRGVVHQPARREVDRLEPDALELSRVVEHAASVELLPRSRRVQTLVPVARERSRDAVEILALLHAEDVRSEELHLARDPSQPRRPREEVVSRAAVQLRAVLPHVRVREEVVGHHAHVARRRRRRRGRPTARADAARHGVVH
eukprot:29427-Pelagococcus_subviridis.AAC.1